MPAAIIAIVALVGVCIWTYPTAAAWFSQLDQSKVIRSATQVERPDQTDDAKQIAQAHTYNDLLGSGAVLEANHRLPSGTGAIGRGAPSYDQALNDGTSGVMSRLRIPGIKLDLPIYHGTSDDTLQKGLGHLEGTSLPVGGKDTRSVITGHRGLADAELFTHLDRVKEGDTFTLTTFGQVLAYRVVETKVIDPDQTQELATVQGRDLVTLVTCTPLGINSQRILVTGERVFPTPDADKEAGLAAPDIPGFPWWAVIVGGSLVAAAGYVWLSGRPVKPTSRGDKRAAK